MYYLVNEKKFQPIWGTFSDAPMKFPQLIGSMNEMDTYIPPNIRLINPISKRFTHNRRFTSNELPSWIEQSQDLMLRSTVSFLIVIYSGPFLSFNHLSYCIFLAPFYTSPFTLCAHWVSVCNWHSLNTNYYGTTLVECQDLLIPTRSNAFVARIYLCLKSHLNDTKSLRTCYLGGDSYQDLGHYDKMMQNFSNRNQSLRQLGHTTETEKGHLGLSKLISLTHD